MPLPPGTSLGCYTIEKTLGVGGFGVTYSAFDASGNNRVAIKENFPASLVHREADGRICLDGDPQDFSWTMRHFLSEARFLASIRHRNIVEVYKAFECNNTAYFAMEYIDGISLDKLASPSCWNHAQFKALMQSMLQALDYLHARNIFHRDVKPTNIMLRRSDDSPVLIDFGAAKAERSHAGHTFSFVSIGYTSPEQMASNNHLSPGVDIYSLGATFHCLLTGSPPPHASERLMHDSCQPLASRADLLKRFPPVLLASIDQALKLDPAQRFRSAAQWLDFLNSGRAPHPLDRQPKAEKRPYAQASAASPIPARKNRPARQAPLASFPPEWRQDEIPLPKMVRYASLFAFSTGSLLLLAIGGSLLGSSVQSHALDAFFPLALILFLLGLIGFACLRYTGPHDGSP